MKKDRNRDYATAAFIDYVMSGHLTCEEQKERIRSAALREYTDNLRRGRKNPVENADIYAERVLEMNEGYLLDVQAVDKTIEALNDSGEKYIMDVVFAVYNSPASMRRGVISARVRRLAVDMPASERVIYKYLKRARSVFCKIRRLNLK